MAVDVKLGLYQGSVLSPLLFMTVMKVITNKLWVGLLLEVLYADDSYLMSPLQGTSTNNCTNLINKPHIAGRESLGYIFPLIVCAYFYLFSQDTGQT